MSGGYADKLKDYPSKGVCGLPETHDTTRKLRSSLNQLVAMVQQSNHFVVLTGAGISTSAGIPDFRGPGGIWTRQQELEKRQKREKRKRKAPEPENTKAEPESAKAKPAAASPEELPAGALDFGAAQPTLTHYALAEMAQRGKLKHVVTQNVDALHQRSGLDRDNLSVLHGCIFEEKCESCGQLELFDKEVCHVLLHQCLTIHTSSSRQLHVLRWIAQVTTISCELTGKKCKSCGGGLRDTLLDWEDELPEDQLARSEQHCVEADLVMTLGTLNCEYCTRQHCTVASILAAASLRPLPNSNCICICTALDLLHASTKTHGNLPTSLHQSAICAVDVSSVDCGARDVS